MYESYTLIQYWKTPHNHGPVRIAILGLDFWSEICWPGTWSGFGPGLEPGPLFDPWYKIENPNRIKNHGPDRKKLVLLRIWAQFRTK